MGVLSSAYYMSRMAQTYFPGIKNMVGKLVDKYVDSIEPEEWTDKVASVNTDDMTYKEKQESRELAMQTAGIMSGQCDNLAEAIQEDPVTWGAYLQEKGMDEEKLQEMQQQIAEDGSISPFDVMKLAIGGSNTPESTEKQEEAQTDSPEATGKSEEAESEQSSEEKNKSDDKDKRANMREEALGSTPADATNDVEYDLGE